MTQPRSVVVIIDTSYTVMSRHESYYLFILGMDHVHICMFHTFYIAGNTDETVSSSVNLEDCLHNYSSDQDNDLNIADYNGGETDSSDIDFLEIDSADEESNEVRTCILYIYSVW